MAHYADEGVIPVSRDGLWKLLQLHLEDGTIPQIHPGIVSQKLLRNDGNEYVFDRGIRFFGRVRHSTWKLTYEPPDRTRWEVLESDGPMKTGSRLVSTYSDAPGGGTLVRSEGEIVVRYFPGFLQKGIVRSALNGIDGQDREYLVKHPELTRPASSATA